MEEIGVVSRIEGMNAYVSVVRKSACEHCTAGTCDLSGDSVTIEAINEAGARVGQKVMVSMRALAYVKGSMLFYGIPALALILGAVMGREFLAPGFEGMNPDAVAAISAFLLMALSFVAVKIATMKVAKSVRYQPVIDKILDD
jgi:sigma-E factor negative regulatory protein RseC